MWWQHKLSQTKHMIKGDAKSNFTLHSTYYLLLEVLRGNKHFQNGYFCVCIYHKNYQIIGLSN